MAKTASLNATKRIGSRCTEGSAPALPPGARPTASQRTQRITAETPAAPGRATHVGNRLDQRLSASAPRGVAAGLGPLIVPSPSLSGRPRVRKAAFVMLGPGPILRKVRNPARARQFALRVARSLGHQPSASAQRQAGTHRRGDGLDADRDSRPRSCAEPPRESGDRGDFERTRRRAPRQLRLGRDDREGGSRETQAVAAPERGTFVSRAGKSWFQWSRGAELRREHFVRNVPINEHWNVESQTPRNEGSPLHADVASAFRRASGITSERRMRTPFCGSMPA
jgi:hypothetical protein